MIALYQVASRVMGGSARRFRSSVGFIALAAMTLLVPSVAQAVTLTVEGPDGTTVPVGYRWLVEEDQTYNVIPGVTCTPADPVENCPGVNFHRSYMPVVSSGHSTGGVATISGLDPLKRYFISILPDEGFANGGSPVAIGQTAVKVLVQPFPLPTAQIRVFVFQDNFPINGAADTPEEVGLADFDVLLSEAGGTYGQSGGHVTQDCFGSPLGTTYNSTCSNDPNVICTSDAECGAGNTCALDANSVQTLGNGHFKTSGAVPGPIGYVVIKNLCPGKYTIQAVPPAGQGWIQTTTIEGTKGNDAWVKANEPSYFQEFGPPGPHVLMGFVKQFNNLLGTGGSSIRGQVKNLHQSRPPDFTQFSGDPVPACWVGLNVGAEGFQSLAAQPCNSDSTFEFSGVPAGDYRVAIWDANLDRIFSLNLVTVDGTNDLDLLDVPVFDWFAHYQGVVFNDSNRNSFRDPGEIGVQDAGLLLRFRDGSIYQETSTDAAGNFEFREIFPFFNWLVAEVDFATKQATGATVVVDGGGPVNPHLGWDNPSFDKLNPQRQCDSFLADGTCVNAGGSENINPITGNNLARTETGPVLLEGIQAFLGQTHVIEWGKAEYPPGHNGGITGIVHYAVTIAENNPQFAAAENWEPGVPRVQVNLYKDSNRDGVIDRIISPASRCSNNPGGPICTTHADCEPVDVPPLGDGPPWGKCGGVRADVDNPPWEWRVCSDDPTATCVSDTECVAGTCGSGTVGAEDVDWNGNGVFDPGDAVSIVTADSWDDALPEGCQGDTPFEYQTTSGPVARDCYDGLRAFGQVRPALWDGGFAFWSTVPAGIASGDPFLEDADLTTIPAGVYIVEGTTPPGYELLREEHKNVDFGPEATPSPLLIPPACYGDQHLLPEWLTLFPGVENPSNFPYDNSKRSPLCDMKQVTLRQGQNGAADLFLMTPVPVAAHITGFILNDFANEFDPNAPTFGEKYSPPYLPISIRDWTGREISRVYSDRWGNYSALVPSTYWVSAPDPSGVSPNMMTACMNSPGPIPNPDYIPGTLVCSGNRTQTCTVDANCGPNQTCLPASPAFVTDPHFDRRYSQFCYTFQYMPGKTTYLDTPVLPIAAYAGPAQFPTDCEFQDDTPVIWSVYGPVGGPYVTGPNQTITIVSAGQVAVPNPAYDEVAVPKTIIRDFGFGDTEGTVTIGNTTLSAANVTWSADVITAVVSNGALGAGAVGQLTVTRSAADGGKRTEVGVTLYRQGTGASTFGVDHVAPSATGWPDRPIQAAIDAAAPGDLILVAPGTYDENVIMWKPVRLQGWGAASTLINAAKIPAERLQWWRDTVSGLITAGSVDLLPAQEFGFALPEPDTLFTEEGPGIVVLAKDTGPNNFPSARNARIDGFGITGADHGGGIFVNGYADFLQISNNRVFANQGIFGGGIRVGHTVLVEQTLNNQGEGALVYQDSHNNSVVIHHNQVIHNGSSNGAGGGISMNHGSDNYRVENNFVCGNFTGGDGGGIGQYGFSNNGLIANNKILFNETFNQGRTSSGGGISIAGAPPLLAGLNNVTPGSGSAQVLNNLIQGNTAGSGDGGGIRLAFINGEDIVEDTGNDNVSQWSRIQIYNNIIIDNIAAQAGGGISLQDAARVNIVNNTIVNNDSTATAGVLFAGGNISVPQVGGIVARAHTTALLPYFQTRPANYCTDTDRQCRHQFSNPVLFNNIIRKNRSFHFSITPNADPAPVFGLIPDIGGGDPPIYWDLSVQGIANRYMNPQDCVLSDNWIDSDSDPYTGGPEPTPGTNPYNAVGGTANRLGNPSFVAEYVNTSPGQTIQLPELTTSIAVQPAFDEGGNFITVRFGPLTPNNPTPPHALFGDEHLGAGSAALNVGTALASIPDTPTPACGTGAPSPLCFDIDGDLRPTPSTGVDIGADERTAAGLTIGGTQPPTEIRPSDLSQPSPETAISPAPVAPSPKAPAPAPAPSLSRRPAQVQSPVSRWFVINLAPMPEWNMKPLESEKKKKSAQATAEPETKSTGTKPAVEGVQ
jgi:hypothetical protein